MDRADVAIVGAGIGGLAAALALSAQGKRVTLLEREDAPGGKMRRVLLAGRSLDAGPTVFTMRWVFDELCAAAGCALTDLVSLKQANILARHAWNEEGRLDLFADLETSVDAIGRFAGAEEARGYRAFVERAQSTYETLEAPFIRSPQPSPFGLVRGAGLVGLGDLWRISPFSVLWDTLGQHFRDVRLRQLFGRYATYCGSSPFEAPATLMLVAHVERQGVWYVKGGMHCLAEALAEQAQRLGARIRYDAEVRDIVVTGGRAAGATLLDGERIEADAVIVNADAAALPARALGSAVARAAPVRPRSSRSLSALTWTLLARTGGFPLVRHNVFFSNDYPAEFAAIFGRRQLPASPTVYVCAEDREDEAVPRSGPERLLVLVNAPPAGDERPFDRSETEPCENATFRLLTRCGLTVDRTPETMVLTTPADFHRLYPGTGGALYGQASHGWQASFSRPTARTAVPGLYLAGGSTHPGPGVPMAALSGRLAAEAVLQDLASTRSFHPAAMPGGMSTP